MIAIAPEESMSKGKIHAIQRERGICVENGVWKKTRRKRAREGAARILLVRPEAARTMALGTWYC